MTSVKILMTLGSNKKGNKEFYMVNVKIIKSFEIKVTVHAHLIEFQNVIVFYPSPKI